MPKTVPQYYYDHAGIHKLTMRRASAHWPNHDMPTIWGFDGTRINDGHVVEGGTEEEIKLFCEFAKKSFILCYQTFYPDKMPCNDPSVNGYMKYFIRDNLKFRTLEWLHEYAPWTIPYATEEVFREARELHRKELEIYAKTSSMADIRND